MTLQIVLSTHPSSYRVVYRISTVLFTVFHGYNGFELVRLKHLSLNVRHFLTNPWVEMGVQLHFGLEQWNTTYIQTKGVDRQNVLLDWKIYLTSRSNTIAVYAV